MLLTSILSRLIRCNPVRLIVNRRLYARLQQGYRLKQSGDGAGARRVLERVLRDFPGNVDAHYLMGALLGERGQLDIALSHLRFAVKLNDSFAAAHAALGNVLLLQNDKQGAIASLSKAAILDPDNAVVRSNLALAYQSCLDNARALPEFQAAYRLQPDLPDLLRGLTISLVDQRRPDEALELLDRRLVSNAGDIEAVKCKGFVLQKIHCPEQALACYERALMHAQDDPHLFRNLGIVLQDLGRIDEAIAAYDKAISLKPDYPMAIWHRSLAYLLCHDFTRGWPDYELRTESLDQPKRQQRFPRWRGESLKGRRLLVCAEQGLGDEIMFASCLPEVIADCEHCIVECAPKLEPLFRQSFPAATVYPTQANGDFPSWLDKYDVDYQSAAGSLPLFLRRNISEFPRHSGYLRPDLQLAAHWRSRLNDLGRSLKVGISWQGGTFRTRQPVRSLPLSEWAPILRMPGASFVSLQYTDNLTEREAAESTLGVRIYDWPEVRNSYEHTAALVSQLDLVISVCTAVIHLGGALGRPVFVMAPFSPEWRYGRVGEHMPWYPSVRVFRQPRYGDWTPVIEKVSREMAKLTARQ